MAVSVDGVYNTLQAWTADLVAGQSESAAVIISSAEGIRGAAALSTYCRSKSAVLGPVPAATIELAPLGVRVNSILPGPIQTPMNQPRSMGPR
jgi:NAD(P)-dependent dehydrogenase (short-subunit alcohol dehydrogenase family)